MVHYGLKWSKMVQDSKMVKDAWSIGKNTFCKRTAWAPKARRPDGKKRKRSTILPISMVQSFFCVLFFSLCSNLSIWPGSQVVPDESRCYIPIFDGLVFVLSYLSVSTICLPPICLIPVSSLSVHTWLWPQCLLLSPAGSRPGQLCLGLPPSLVEGTPHCHR